MAGDIDALIVLLMACALWVRVLWYRRRRRPLDRPDARATVQRLLKPRTPEDCPACHRQLARSPHAPGRLAPVAPWRERKSRRGAPKRIATDGFACPNHACDYCGITDVAIHALVADGRTMRKMCTRA